MKPGVPIGQQQAPQRNEGPAAAAIPMGGAGSPPSGPAGPFGGNGPNMLPTARGAHGDAGIGANGVVDAASGGMRVVPELYGLGSEIAGLVQNGASREQVLAHYQERMAGAGMTPNAGQDAMINEIISNSLALRLRRSLTAGPTSICSNRLTMAGRCLATWLILPPALHSSALPMV